MAEQNIIPVTKPSVPSFEAYSELLKGIWDREYFTNNGPLVKSLEKEVSSFLNCAPNLFVTNGTIALQLALRALDVKGKVITTPYSYVATTSSILWENCTPVFIDCLSNGNIDPDLIEAAITSDTSAIMATHVYGYPCEVEKIQEIANKYKLKVIYDAAHAFGVKVNGQSIFDFGDVSTVSYHATKLFHTVEGGGIFSKDNDIIEKIKLLRAFGHQGDTHYCLGINGKQSELHAAMGLLNLKDVNENILGRREKYEMYATQLSDKLSFIHKKFDEIITYNYSYVPVLLKNEKEVLDVIARLKEKGILLRRYFYPSLNKLPYLNEYRECPVSEDLASRAVCLPIYNSLKEEEQQYVIDNLKELL